MTLRELFEQFNRRSLTEEATRIKCRSAWLRLMLCLGTELDVAKVTSEHVARFQRYLRDQAVTPRGRSFSDASVFSYVASVSQVFTWAAAKDRRYVKVNPVRDADRIKATKRQVRVFAPEEVRDLLDTVRGHTEKGIKPLTWVWWDKSGTVRWTAMILTALTGPRLGEVLNLRWEDIDLAAGVVHIRSRGDLKGEHWRWTAKGKAERDLPISDDQGAVLRQLQAVAPWRYPFLKERRCLQLQAKVGRLPEAVRKRPFDTWDADWRRVLRVTNQRRAAAGKPEIVGQWHMLRKTSATNYAMAGLPMEAVQQILGHATPTLTAQVYVRLDEQKAIRAGREALNGLHY